MIYVDTSALVKIVVSEVHSESMRRYAVRPMVTSDLTAVELRRAVRRIAPERLVLVDGVLAQPLKLSIDAGILRTASMLDPANLRTLDAIHLASALVVRDELEAFVAYDERLLEAARLAGIPTVSPGA